MKKKLLIITGPTGVGKTEISIKIAKALDGEIISADSMQIYKYMDIGSAKITIDEMQGIPHHMIDIIDPREDFSVAAYKSMTEKIIDEIYIKNKVPMLVGGTGLYISSIISNYNFNNVYKDDAYRDELYQYSITKGNKFVHEMLKDIDYISYESIHPNNLKRVIRALEVYKVSGIPFSNISDNSYENNSSPYEVYYYVLNMDRDKLYERINNRVDLMINSGLIDEVKNLKEIGCSEENISMKGIGYKEILRYLQGEITIDNAIDMIKQGSRNYAKRQITWFKKEKSAIWINREDFKDEICIAQEILNNFKGI